jgi:cobyrinic acid a,c-diamide synthase
MVKSAMSDIVLLASMSKQQQSLPERHLGLVPADEVDELDVLLDNFADQLDLDMEQWLRIPPVEIELTDAIAPVSPALFGKHIAIARDAAFNFIYPANLACLIELGAQLHFFSPLANEPVPAGAQAVYLPGGYPELHAEILSQALIWQESIRQAHHNGVPIWAECGGMMALTDQLLDLDGKAWPMAGILSGSAVMQKRLGGLGMQGLKLPAGELRGHTFHYSTLSTTVTPVAHTFKQRDASSNGEAVYKIGSLTASYFHAYFPSCPAAVALLLKGEF